MADARINALTEATSLDDADWFVAEVGDSEARKVSVETVRASMLSTVTDDFNRANGAIGFPPWVPFADGALTISSNKVVGIAAQASGAVHTREMYPADQYAEITVSSTALSSGEWIAAVIRSQQDPGASLGYRCYLGLYFNESGTHKLRLYRRDTVSSFTQLGSDFATGGALSAGQVVRLEATGTTIALSLDGDVKISQTDTTYADGYPGLAAFGAAFIDAWATDAVLGLAHGYAHYNQHSGEINIAGLDGVSTELAAHLVDETAHGKDPIFDKFGTPTTAFEFSTSSLTGLTALPSAPDVVDADTTVPGCLYIEDDGSAVVGRYAAATPPFTVIARMSDNLRTDSTASGIFIGESTPSNIRSVGRNRASGTMSMIELTWTTLSITASAGATTWRTDIPVWLAIVVTSNTDADFAYSADGMVWVPCLIATNPGITVGSAGVFLLAGSVRNAVVFDFVRIFNSALVLPGAN